MRQDPSPTAPLVAQPPLDVALARLAQRQHGVVALAQLRMLGLSASGVRDRAAAGRLHRVHRGVYSVGHALLSVHGRWTAAVLAYGGAAVLSHRSAAALWNLRSSARTRIDVSLPGRSGRSRPGIDLHKTTTLRAEDVTVGEGIQCTTVARTLLDLADVVGPRELERAAAQAEVLRLLDVRAVEDVLVRAGGRRGTGRLREVCRAAAEPALTASELEERFLSLCDRAGLPRPEVNVRLLVPGGQATVDFLWRAARLVVETDGHAFHGHRRAFERDRHRDQLLMLGGYHVVRCTWRQVVGEPERLAATMRALLARHRRRSAGPS